MNTTETGAYSIRLPEELLEKLRERKAQTGIPISQQIKRAVEKFFKEGKNAK